MRENRNDNYPRQERGGFRGRYRGGNRGTRGGNRGGERTQPE